MNITHDCLLRLPLKSEQVSPLNDQVVQYFHDVLGRVRVPLAVYQELLQSSNISVETRYILSGICRLAYEDKAAAPLLDSEFVHGGYKKLDIPLDFPGRVRHLLKFIYTHGGSENVKREFHSGRDCLLAYCLPEEFCRLVEHLEKNHWIRYSSPKTMSSTGEIKYYWNVELTTFGADEVQKLLPQVPMISLVSQEITTGDVEVDAKINHAKDLFFGEPSSMDKMRNACETLIFVLEPLRNELKNYFTTSDVSSFFHIVNEFDIRHNKNSTKTLMHEEQLEWVFYTLLNTVNCYTKLKKKLTT